MVVNIVRVVEEVGGAALAEADDGTGLGVDLDRDILEEGFGFGVKEKGGVDGPPGAHGWFFLGLY